MIPNLRAGGRPGALRGENPMIGPKWLRKNSRAVIFVFMALLLVAFLLGDVIQYFGTGQDVDRPIGQAVNYNTTVTYSQYQRAEMVQNVSAAIGVQMAQLPTLEFLLLSREADQMGIRVGHDQVRQRLVQVFGAETDRVVANLMNRMRLGQDTLFDLLADGMRVEQAVRLQSLGTGESLPRMRERFREQNQQAELKMSVIDAAVLTSHVPDPTDQEVRAFFEAHRDQNPNPAGSQDGTELSFGYRLPDRVKIEYITLAPEQIKSVRVREVEAQRFFEQRKDRYMKTVSPEPTSTAPTEQVPMTFEEAESQVRQDYRQIKAIELAQQIVNDIRSEAYAPWSAQPLDDDGFRKTPPRQISLKELADRHAARHPVQYGVTELSSASELMQHFPRMPQYSGGGGTRLNLPAYAFQVQGLFKPDKDRPTEMLAVGEPSQVLMTDQYVQGRTIPYQPYVFRVLEVAPAGPPEDIAPFADRVRQDLKLKRAFELAGEKARELADAARQSGLDQAVAQASELRTMLGGTSDAVTQPSPEAQEALRMFEVSTQPRFTRSNPMLPGLGAVPHAAETIFALAAQPGEHKTTAVPGPAAKKWAVVELQRVTDVYQGDFDAQRDAYRDPMGMWLAQMQLLDPENIRARAGWKEAQEPEDQPVQ